MACSMLCTVYGNSGIWYRKHGSGRTRWHLWFKDTFGVPVWITGAVSAVLVASVILGGVENIAKVCNVLVPFMALFYVVGCLIILAMGYQTIPASIALILKSAFTGQAGGRRIRRIHHDNGLEVWCIEGSFL